MALPTTPEVLSIANVCGFLAADDEANQMALKGGFLRQGLSQYIFMIRKGVQWLYDTFPSSDTLAQKTSYLYWLCLPYIQRALVILNSGGTGGIINPATGQGASIQEVFYQSEVDGTGTPPLTTGQTSFVITDDFILNNSLQIVIDNSVLPYGAYTDRLSYTVVYTNTDATITIYNGSPNIGLQGLMVVQVRGLKFVTL